MKTLAAAVVMLLLSLPAIGPDKPKEDPFPLEYPPALPMSELDPVRLIYYGGTAPGKDDVVDGEVTLPHGEARIVRKGVKADQRSKITP